jgi:hypothetical protein
MTTSRVIVIFVLYGLVAPLASSNSQQAPLNDKLHVAIHSYELKAGSVVEALALVAKDFQIPMGIEWVSNPSARRPMKLSWKDTTLADILQTIAAQQRLRMVADGDVLRVSSQLIPNHENPFKIEIKEFAVQNVPAESASRLLHEIVKRNISPSRRKSGRAGGVAGSGFSNTDDFQISLQARGLTLEQILDRLVSVSARKIWIATFSDRQALTAAGYRQTAGLWTSSPAPEDEQPVWDMLHWGDAIPANPGVVN